MTKKITETPVVLTELQEPIAETEDGVELNKVIDKMGIIHEPSEETLAINKQMNPAEMPVMEAMDSDTYPLQWAEGNGTWKESDLSDSFENPLGKLFAVRLNELEARLDYNDRRIAVLMKDREAYIRLLHGRMNNETGLQAMINGWEDA